MTGTEQRKTAGTIGGRDHFTDVDLDSAEFTENYEEVLGACPEQAIQLFA